MSAAANRAAVRRYFEAYDTGRLEAVMAFVSSRHIHHPGRGEALDYEGRKRDDGVFFSAFSDIKTTVEDQVAEGDKVVSRVTMRCRQTGPYQGFKPTGKPVTITFIDISRVRGGKIEEEWVEFDSADIVRQISAATR